MASRRGVPAPRLVAFAGGAALLVLLVVAGALHASAGGASRLEALEGALAERDSAAQRLQKRAARADALAAQLKQKEKELKRALDKLARCQQQQQQRAAAPATPLADADVSGDPPPDDAEDDGSSVDAEERKRLEAFRRAREEEAELERREAKRREEEKRLQQKIAKAQGPKHYREWQARLVEKAERERAMAGIAGEPQEPQRDAAGEGTADDEYAEEERRR